MAALAFIRLLEERGLLDPDIVVEITRQVETSKVRITPEAIARLLVDNGQLTRFQATKLISELNETIDRPRNDATTALRGGRPLDEEVNDTDSVEDLLPDDWKPAPKTPDALQKSHGSSQSSRPGSNPERLTNASGVRSNNPYDPKSESLDLEEMSSDADGRVFLGADGDDSDILKNGKNNGRSDELDRRQEIVDAELVEEGFVDDLEDSEITANQLPYDAPTPSRASSRPPPVPAISNKPHVAPKVPKSQSGASRKNAWDSFRILGIGSILGVLLLVLFPLLFWFTQGSADDAYQSAKNAYETRNYSQASKGFSDFARSYPRDANASSARVLAVLANVRENAERVSDPLVALKSAQDQLPTILSEDGLAALRPDMTDAMLRIADKFSEKIDSTSDLEAREALLTNLNSLVEMLNDSRFLGAQERAQNALRLRNLEESVSRAKRGILRDSDRLIAVAKMQESIEAKNVAQTYEIRRELLRKYPVLEGDAEIAELLAQAVSIQQGLIVDAKEMPELSAESSLIQEADRVYLSYRDSFGTASTSNEASDSGSDVGSTIFINSKGTLVALASMDGAIRWQKLISPDWISTPLYDLSIPDSDVTISLPDKGIVRRHSASDGSLIWEANFQSPILEPKIDGEDIFIACVSGAAHCLDAASGTPKWGKQFPQEISSPIAGAHNKRYRYVIANNSNLYAISKSGGTCQEVAYLGHLPDTIKVAPIWILNHLLVFENTGPDYSNLRIYETDSEGLNIRASAQLPIRFRGNFVVAPEVDGRRFSIATNLGEFAVFEVDPSNRSEKVHRVASFVEQEHAPRITWPKMVGSDLYLTSNRIAMYEIQVSSQKLNRVWQREDGDEFLGRPIATSNGIIHTRLVRGNLGTRVTLVDPKKGDMKWETEIASPVSVLTSNVTSAGAMSGGEEWTALTSLGSLFRFSTSDIDGNATVLQTESLGRNQRMVKFTRSLKLPNGRIVLFNESKSDQLLLVDPKRKTTASKLFSINLGGGTVTQDPVLAGKHIVLPLSNSQVALVNSDQMQTTGSPFQPTLSAGEKSNWSNPVTVQNGKTIIIADRDRILYKLSVGNQLTNSLEVDLENSLTGRLANIDETIFAVSTMDSADQIELLNALELKTEKSVPLDGRLVWGPYSVNTDLSEQPGNSLIVLVQSDLEGLIALSKSGEKLWQIPLEQSEIIGSPITHSSGCLLMTVHGEVLNLALDTGKILGRSQIGSAPSSSPIVVGNDLLIPTMSGAVVKLQIPSE